MSVRLICQRYQLTERPLLAANRNGATPHGKRISAEERRVITRYNELDCLIYEDARKQFGNVTVQTALGRAESDTLERPVHT